MISAKTMTKENYVMNDTKPVWKSLCNDCSLAAKKAGITKKTTREMLREIREKNSI